MVVPFATGVVVGCTGVVQGTVVPLTTVKLETGTEVVVGCTGLVQGTVVPFTTVKLDSGTEVVVWLCTGGVVVCSCFEVVVVWLCTGVVVVCSCTGVVVVEVVHGVVHDSMDDSVVLLQESWVEVDTCSAGLDQLSPQPSAWPGAATAAEA